MPTNRISFRVEPYDDEPASAPCIEPVIDGTPMTRLVGGDHAGLVWYAPLVDADVRGHYLADRFGVLGCSCGEFGCDPVSVECSVGDRTVAWRAPHHGPFLFARDEYERALDRLVRDLEPFRPR